MKTIEYNSEMLFLWTEPPEWGTPPEAEFSMPAKSSNGLSDRQARTPNGDALKVEAFNFSCVLDDFDLREIADTRRAQSIERVAMPFWPAVRMTDEGALGIRGAVNITFDLDDEYQPDFSSYEIHKEEEPQAWPVTEATRTAPLLFGFIEDLEPSIEDEDCNEFSVKFIESSQATEALLFSPGEFAAGSEVSGISPKLFPFESINYAIAPQAGASVLKLERNSIGAARELHVEYNDTLPYDVVTFGVTAFNDPEWVDVLRFFKERGGIVEPFWIPAHMVRTELSSNLVSGQTLVYVNDGDSFANIGHVAFQRGSELKIRRVTAIESATIEIDEPIEAGTIWEADSVRVMAALLVRFSRKKLKLRWVEPDCVESKIEFRELPTETTLPDGEVVGQTIGAQSIRASLYTLKSGDTVERYTSYEYPLSLAGDEFQMANGKITHGNIRRTITLDNSVALDCDLSAIGLIDKLCHKKVKSVEVLIQRVDVNGSAASNARVEFNGRVKKPIVNGNRVSVQCGLWSALDILIPQHRAARVCPPAWKLFGGLCKLLESDWTFGADVQDPGAPGYPYSLTLENFTRSNGGALPDGFGFQDWFAGGILRNVGGEEIRIKSSNAIIDGSLTVVLDRDPETFFELGDPVDLIPGCDGQFGTCKAYHAADNPRGKFDNADNWGGAQVALANLSLVKVDIPGGNSGGKK
ncbi:MAG: phage BR0599 family protein [Verrucomicrobiota bacterium]